MDRVDELIQSFNAGKETDKLGIVDELEDYEDDERVLHFYLDILLNQDESDLARIEVLKILSLHDYSPKEHLEVGSAIMRVLRSDPRMLVRSYATMAMYPFMTIPGALDTVGEVLLNTTENESVRHSALVVVEDVGPTDRTIEMLQAVKDDRSIGTSAARVLSEWGHG